ncbi:MAG: hypothetical protein CMH36_09450 [Microbacterium sp.]|uniref:Mannosyltransferase (PIG-V) n=1 Tax=Microbacterium ginsengisoli TaxID=400772 RepID=A0A0F0M1Z8_9MICO|nr:hypothetical protein [Microbacterium ginsengisoli]KJL38572.1 hypothetical protein RR49_00658 [Microbacterium ginsengisoli]MAL07038.1 hypothetical protein [Microbacterium sp.]MBN9209172.1 hypothetical protein [Microbacterium ginsengisoli]HAN24399.1 hypothetical protein [Microbacterium ginsengisoli]
MTTSGDHDLRGAAGSLPPAATVASPLRRRAVRAWQGLLDWFEETSQPNPAVRPVTARAVRAVVGVWALGRGVNFLLMFVMYELAHAFGWAFGPNAQRVTTFLQFLSDWDGARYGRVSQIGYPTQLPLDAYGAVVPNDWAFLPVFPWLERIISDATGIPWQIVGISIAVLASGGATIMLFLLLRAVTSPTAAWWGAVLFSFGPMSFIFVVGYAESLYLFLLFAAMLLAVKRRYLWIIPIGLVASYTRPGILAFALGLGIVFVTRWFRRKVDPFPPSQLVSLMITGLVLAGAGLSWSWIADAVTGTPHAYLLTETSWWVPFVGEGHFAPFTPWFRMAWTFTGIIGVVLVAALIAAFLLWIFSRPVRRLGMVVATYGFGYGVYLFAVFLPQQSIFRLLLPMTPMLGDERLSSTRRRRIISLVAALVGQVLAVLLLWTIGFP